MYSEEQEKKLNHEVFINGYIRTKIKPRECQQDIINLCIKFFKILDIATAKDSVNFVSDQDVETCDRFKTEGNAYHKQKQYEAAIAKYTTALRYNPNNHLVLNNRALCHYMLGNYKDAKKDAFESICKEPSFMKSWYRYGAIFEAQKNYKNAGVCYKAAYCLSIGWHMRANDSQKRNHYKINYFNFIAKIKKSGEMDVVDWIKGFEEKCKNLSPESLMENFLFKSRDKEMMTKMMNSQGGMQQMLMELMQNKDYLEAQDAQKLYCLFMESKYKALIEGNKLQQTNETLNISYSSLPNIEHKRVFNVTVSSSQSMRIAGQFLHYGRPRTKDMLRYLYRTMAFSNMLHTKETKPRSVVIDWRSRDMFDEIQQELGTTLGIQCVQETYEESKKVCKDNETDINGWNHLE